MPQTTTTATTSGSLNPFALWLPTHRCGEEGAAVYRLYADAEYQRCMLRLVSHLYRRHVVPGVPPSAQVYATCKETAEDYSWLLQRTRELAAGAQRVAGCNGAQDGSHRLCERWGRLSSNNEAWV